MASTITSYAQLGAYIDGVLSDLGVGSPGPPHRAFWRSLTYTQFVNGNIPGVGVPALVSRHSDQSNIILALRGLPPFDGSQFSQMPEGGPFFSSAQIQPIADWIDAGCPQ
jgi:hypothetical protein